MSIKALVESIEMARQNNTNLSVSLEGKFNAMIAEVFAARNAYAKAADTLAAKLEEVKLFVAAEFHERDSDLVKLMDGAA